MKGETLWADVSAAIEPSSSAGRKVITPGRKLTLKLRGKLILITVSTVLLVTGVNTYLNISDFIHVYKERVTERVFIQIQPLKTIMEDILALGLALSDIEEINRECQNLVKNISYSSYCFVTDGQGRVYFHSSPEQVGALYSDPTTQGALASPGKLVQVYTMDSGEKVYDFSLPIEKLDGKQVGQIRVGLQYRIIDEEVSRLIRQAIILGILSVLFSGLMIFYFSQRSILRPVRQLMEGITRFGRGELESRVHLKTGDEIGELAKSFNHMAESILNSTAQRKKTEEILERQTRELVRSNTELEKFAYIASHDLQEPLRKVTAFGDRLKAKCGDGLGDQGRDYLARMQNAAQRMQTLIEGLLTYSRVMTKAQPFVSVDLSQVIREVISDLEVRIEQTRGRVVVDELPTIEADPLQIRQLLQNLIGNALKFSKKDTAPVVKVYSAPGNADGQRPNFSRIVVEDNGIGFDQKYAEQIFGVFQRLHGRSEYEGTGIGLSVCRKIAERHSGTIEAVSSPGQGAKFIITLPVTQSTETLNGSAPQ